MELQLRLALPATPVKNFDLNCNVTDPKDPPSSALCALGDDMVSGDRSCRKRGFLEAFDPLQPQPPRTLPLLLWNYRPNADDEHDHREGVEIIGSLLSKRNDDGNCIVGWPPIKSRRTRAGPGNDDENGRPGSGRNQNSRYVKVHMEGVGIARKINLSRHHSYHALISTLIDMFGKCQQDFQSFKLAYQDQVGDWLLAGDVPWRTFIQSVQRLKLLKAGGGS